MTRTMTEEDYQIEVKKYFPKAEIKIEHGIVYCYGNISKSNLDTSIVVGNSLSKKDIWQKTYESIIKDRTSNKDRNRSYGLRTGDIVQSKSWKGYISKYEVVRRSSIDNNEVFCRDLETGNYSDEVAEWLDLIEKVEDRKGNYKNLRE